MSAVTKGALCIIEVAHVNLSAGSWLISSGRFTDKSVFFYFEPIFFVLTAKENNKKLIFYIEKKGSTGILMGNLLKQQI